MYILISNFCEDIEILMISEDYNKVKECLKNHNILKLHVYSILQCETDKKLGCEDKKTIVKLILHLDGSISSYIDENYKY